MDLLKKILSPKRSQSSQLERRRAPRYRLKQGALVCTETRQAICVIVEDIAVGGVKFRSDSPLKEDENYVLKLKANGKSFLFGLKVLWKRKEYNGNRVYGGNFVGPGSQDSFPFKEFLATFDWKPVFQHLEPA